MTSVDYEEYEELTVENPHCSRRFHLYFNPKGDIVNKTEIHCPHCQATVLTKEKHPELHLAREENLVNVPQCAGICMKECYLINK